MSISGTPTTTGNDIVTVTPTGAYSVNGDLGTDTLVMDFSTLGGDIRYQDIGGGWFRYTDDVLTWLDFVNFEKFNLTGGSGDDVLVGRNMVDTLTGGAGDDHLVSGMGADILNGGAGFDRWTADYSTMGVAVTLKLLASGVATAGGSNAKVQGIEALTMTSGAGHDNIDTSVFVGNDTVNSGAGNDTIALGRGYDSTNGGDGTDTLVMDWSGITDPNGGISWSDIGGSWGRYSATGGNRLDFVNFERFRMTGGAGNDYLGGGALGDQLTGNDGNDFLDSGAGPDTVSGGAGLDTWRVDTSARVGTTVINLETQTSNAGVLSGIERLLFTGGNAADNITALSGHFDDSFTTGNGNDTVRTGRGSDSANAGDGVDTLVMDWSGITDVRHGISNIDIGGSWRRYVSASGDRLDYYGFETFVMTGGSGDDLLYGGGLDDTLKGGIGDDNLQSGIGGGVIDGGEGVDRWNADLSALGTAVFSAAASQTVAQLGTLGLAVTGIEAVDLTTGNGNDNITMAGYANNDSFSTQAGNDSVNVGLGFDWINGGTGDDVLIADYSSAVTAVTQRDIGGGWTRLEMGDGSNRTDYYSMERFNLTGGSGNDAMSGGALNDTLTGGDGNDWLNGNRGSDQIAGGAGVDTWVGDYSHLGTNVSMVLSAAGAASVGGTGTKLTGIENVSISTGSGNDTINLSAASGDDTVNTGDGDDTILMGRGHHESLNAGTGTDSMTVSFALAGTGIRMWDIGGGWWRAGSTGGDYQFDFVNVETVNIAGSARSDRINGFYGDDTLNGGAGVDFVDGGRGNDRLTGGAGPDVFVFSDIWNAGVDLITDAAAGDMLRMVGVTLSGVMGAGDGTGLLGGQMDLSVSGGITTLHLGLDGVAGADFSVQLTGVYDPIDFTLSGSNLLLI